MIKIAVIGVGSMGRNHLRLCAELPIYNLVGFYDPNPENAFYAERYGIQSFDSVEAALESAEAVSIAAPSSMHLELGLKAAAAGKHALIEKPLGMNVQEAKALKSAFERAQKALMVGHVERFNPVVMEIHKLLQKEEVIAVDVRRCSPWNGRITDADVIQDLMIHDLDIVSNLLNNVPVRNGSAFGKRVHSPHSIDYAQAILCFENDVIVSATASRVTEDKVREVVIHLKHALVRADLLNRVLTITRNTSYFTHGESALYRQENVTEKVFVPQQEPLRTEFEAFADSVANSIAPAVSAEEALHALELVDLVRKSCETQKT